MVKLSDLPNYDSANTIQEKLKVVQSYFMPKNQWERIDSELIWDLVNEILTKPIDEINLGKAFVNLIISSYEMRHKEQINYFVDELIRKNFFLFNEQNSIRYFNKMTQIIQEKIIKDKIDENKNNTRDYINFFAENKNNPNNYELFLNAFNNECFIILFQENILKHFEKELKNTTLNTYTFDSLTNYNINFSADFQKQIAKLIQSSNKNKSNFGLVRSAIVGLRVNFMLFSEETINGLLKQQPEFAISGLLGESNILNALRINPLLLKNVLNQTEEMCEAAVRINGLALEYVKEQTDKLCLIAVQSNGLALQHVKKQTEEICLAAVISNGLALKYVINKTKDICLIAFNQNSLLIEFFNVDLFDEFTTDYKILEIYSKNTNYEKLLLVIYNKNELDNEYKIKKIDQCFSLYVRYLLSKEQGLNSFVELSKSIIKINNNTDYYNSFVLETSKNPQEVFNLNRFIWFSDHFDQALLHLFNGARILSNIDNSTMVGLYVAKFRLEKEIKVINSKSSFNNNIFDDIIPRECLLAITNALKERHHYYIILTTSKNKLVTIYPKKVFEKGNFANENNKFILVVLNELNKFLYESNRVYGYVNNFDQKEFALVDRNNLINQTSIQISRYTRVIKKDGTEIIFPITYDDYHKNFKDAFITLYSSFDDMSTFCKTGNIKGDCLEIINCMEKKGVIKDSFRMYKLDNTQIFYQDFDHPDQEIEFKNLNLDDYWKNKYLKYKAKYRALKNKII